MTMNPKFTVCNTILSSDAAVAISKGIWAILDKTLLQQVSPVISSWCWLIQVYVYIGVGVRMVAE